LSSIGVGVVSRYQGAKEKRMGNKRGTGTTKVSHKGGKRDAKKEIPKEKKFPERDL